MKTSSWPGAPCALTLKISPLYSNSQIMFPPTLLVWVSDNMDQDPFAAIYEA